MKMLYIAKEGFWLGTYNYKVTNSEKKVIGHVRRHLFNFNYPFTKERHGCTVKIAETNENFRLTTHLSLRVNESEKTIPSLSLSFERREFGGANCPYRVTYEDKKEYAQQFKITKGKKTIAHIYKASYNDGFLAHRYIIGYDDKRNENTAVLISLAIHLITLVS